jgi:bacterioferritin (cytochrome b1)
VVGRNRMIDELNEGLCKNLAAFDQLVLHKCD